MNIMLAKTPRTLIDWKIIVNGKTYEVEEEAMCCPYCGYEMSGFSCCGEAGHEEKHYFTVCEERFSEHEIDELIETYAPRGEAADLAKLNEYLANSPYYSLLETKEYGWILEDNWSNLHSAPIVQKDVATN